MRGRDDAVDAFALEQAMQQLADDAAGRIDRGDVAAEAVHDARDVDAAAAGVALRRRAAQLHRRLDTTDIDENVDGGINRERDDVGHVCCLVRSVFPEKIRRFDHKVMFCRRTANMGSNLS